MSKNWKRISADAYAHREELEDAQKIWAGRSGDSWSFHVKADIDGAFSETGSGSIGTGGTGQVDSRGPQYGGVVGPDYIGLVGRAERQPFLQQLLGNQTTSSNLIRLGKETTTTDSSGVTGEGVAYGAVKVEVTPKDYPVYDVTALAAVTEDFLADAPNAASYLSQRLARLVTLKSEAAILTGTYGFGNIPGITRNGLGSAKLVDGIARLSTDVANDSGLVPSWVVMSPHTAYTYVTNENAAGARLEGEPSHGFDDAWWMKPYINAGVTDDKVYVGSPGAATIFTHTSGLEIAFSPDYGNYFGEGLVAVRGKIRQALVPEYPQGIGVLGVSS